MPAASVDASIALVPVATKQAMPGPLPARAQDIRPPAEVVTVPVRATTKQISIAVAAAFREMYPMFEAFQVSSGPCCARASRLHAASRTTVAGSAALRSQACMPTGQGQGRLDGSLITKQNLVLYQHLCSLYEALCGFETGCTGLWCSLILQVRLDIFVLHVGSEFQPWEGQQCIDCLSAHSTVKGASHIHELQASNVG